MLLSLVDERRVEQKLALLLFYPFSQTCQAVEPAVPLSANGLFADTVCMPACASTMRMVGEFRKEQNVRIRQFFVTIHGAPPPPRERLEFLDAGFLTEINMHRFLSDNRDELIARCSAKVLQRPRRSATTAQLANGIPMFLDQLMRTLVAQEKGDADGSFRISGASGGDAAALSEMGVSAAAHGRALMELGYSVDQVVHDYGDLCQAITGLAVERDAAFSVDEFRTLNRCLDNAIADAVTEFGIWRDASVAVQNSADENERLGVLVHEIRNYLHTAKLAFAALESGNLPIGGATGAVLKRSLSSLAALLSLSLSQVRGTIDAHAEAFALGLFVDEAKNAASLDASAKGCTLLVDVVDAELIISGNRELLLAALTNLLQNAFKFTHAHTEVVLRAFAEGDHVLIEVKDHCGGLPSGATTSIFQPFVQVGDNKSGLGLGLFIARRNVEANGGVLIVQDVPGTGCVFTIKVPRITAHER